VKTYTGDELRLSLGRTFGAPSYLGMICNDTYAAVTAAWVEDKFAAHFRDYLFSRDLLRYAVQGNQCEHFAMQCLCEAVNCYRATTLPAGAPESIAAAWLAFTPDASPRQGHAIIAFLIADVWCGWEPQTQLWRPITVTEATTVHHPFVL
jgi:hypothetical protein